MLNRFVNLGSVNCIAKLHSESAAGQRKARGSGRRARTCSEKTVRDEEEGWTKTRFSFRGSREFDWAARPNLRSEGGQ